MILAKSDYLVAEADEFDRSFLQLFPQTAVITATDPDHLDIYGTVENMRAAFADFAKQIEMSGYLIIKKGAPMDLSNVKAKIYTYSYTQKADFCPQNIEQREGGHFKFDLLCPDRVIKECTV